MIYHFKTTKERLDFVRGRFTEVKPVKADEKTAEKAEKTAKKAKAKVKKEQK